AGRDPVVLRGGMGTKARRAALERLSPTQDGTPLLVVATGPYIGEGFDCPALDTLFLAAPITFKGRLVQYAGRICGPTPARPPPRSTTTTTSRPLSSPRPLPPRTRLHQPRIPRPTPLTRPLSCGRPTDSKIIQCPRGTLSHFTRG
ncbi:MAG: hypothetical protein M3460_29300, partial [Actinomycetota bacterium]|nr:hypothetical protein [Actinomycetota bacterium]